MIITCQITTISIVDFQQARAYAIYTVNVADTTLTVEEDRAAEDRLDADVALKNIVEFFPFHCSSRLRWIQSLAGYMF